MLSEIMASYFDLDFAMNLIQEEDNCTDSIPPALKKKTPNWTDIERKKILVDEVHQQESILYGRFKGCSGGKASKEKALAEVAEAVNA